VSGETLRMTHRLSPGLSGFTVHDPPVTRVCGTVSPDACGDWSGAITAPGLARYRPRQPERR